MTATLKIEPKGDHTDWYRWNPDKEVWEFNHRQRGWDSTQTRPTPRSKLKFRAWKGAKWRKERVQTRRKQL